MIACDSARRRSRRSGSSKLLARVSMSNKLLTVRKDTSGQIRSGRLGLDELAAGMRPAAGTTKVLIEQAIKTVAHVRRTCASPDPHRQGPIQLRQRRQTDHAPTSRAAVPAEFSSRTPRSSSSVRRSKPGRTSTFRSPGKRNSIPIPSLSASCGSFTSANVTSSRSLRCQAQTTAATCPPVRRTPQSSNYYYPVAE